MNIFKSATAACLLLALCSAVAFAGDKKQTFIGTTDEVFDAAAKTAQHDWSITFADRKLGMISFNTGTSFTSNGMECSASISDAGNGRVLVTLKTQKKNGQVIAWGVGDRIADKFFRGINEELSAEKPQP